MIWLEQAQSDGQDFLLLPFFTGRTDRLGVLECLGHVTFLEPCPKPALGCGKIREFFALFHSG